MKIRQATAALGLSLAVFVTSASATTLQLRDGTDILLDGASTGLTYSGTHDAELRSRVPHRNRNFDLGTGGSAADPEFTVDLADGGGQAQVVMRFDDLFGGGAGQIALGSTIHSATLFIDIDNTGANLELYELTTDFGDESTVTWNSYGGGVTPGVNAAAAPIATINGNGNKTFIDVTSSIAAWAAGGTNFGWAFLSTGTNGVDFDTSENFDFADRPMLTIDFTTVAPAVVPIPHSIVMALPAFLFVFGLSRRNSKLIRATQSA